MARRRSSALDLATGLGLAGLHAGITLWYRLPMLAAACSAGASHDPEIARMIGEKAGAAIEGAADAHRETIRLMAAAAVGRLDAAELMAAPARIASAGLKPAFRRVRDNSRRLHRKSFKSAS